MFIILFTLSVLYTKYHRWYAPGRHGSHLRQPDRIRRHGKFKVHNSHARGITSTSVATILTTVKEVRCSLPRRTRILSSKPRRSTLAGTRVTSISIFHRRATSPRSWTFSATYITN